MLRMTLIIGLHAWKLPPPPVIASRCCHRSRLAELAGEAATPNRGGAADPRGDRRATDAGQPAPSPAHRSRDDVRRLSRSGGGAGAGPGGCAGRPWRCRWRAHALLLAVGAAYSFWTVDELSPPRVAVSLLTLPAAPPPPPAARAARATPKPRPRPQPDAAAAGHHGAGAAPARRGRDQGRRSPGGRARGRRGRRHRRRRRRGVDLGRAAAAAPAVAAGTPGADPPLPRGDPAHPHRLPAAPARPRPSAWAWRARW